MVVWRLEEPEAGTAQHEPPNKPEVVGVGRYERQQEAPHAEHRQADAAEYARMYASHEPSRQRRHEDDGQRPRRHEQSGAHGIVAESGDKHERHAHHDEHLGGERDDARGHRGGEDGYLEQVERQHGVLLAYLHAHVDKAHGHHGHCPQQHNERLDVVRVSLDAAYEQSERGGVEHGLAPVERPADHAHGVVGQMLAGHDKRKYAHRHVDGKQPRPWRHGQDGGRERRPCHRGYGHDGGVEPNPLAQAALGVDELDHRRVHAHHHRCPDSLHHAGNDKHGERRRERAQQ